MHKVETAKRIDVDVAKFLQGVMCVGSDCVKCALVCPNIKEVEGPFLHDKPCHYTATSGTIKGREGRKEASREKGGM